MKFLQEEVPHVQQGVVGADYQRGGWSIVDLPFRGYGSVIDYFLVNNIIVLDDRSYILFRVFAYSQ